MIEKHLQKTDSQSFGRPILTTEKKRRSPGNGDAEGTQPEIQAAGVC
jgi:hypothetical protein